MLLKSMVVAYVKMQTQLTRKLSERYFLHISEWFSILFIYLFQFCIFVSFSFCRYILNFLRTGQLIYPKENKVLAKELYLEAKFYQIIDVHKAIWSGGGFQNSSYIINNLNDEQRNALLSWLPPQDIFINWVQLYSSSVQGWSTASFHQICNNKGPTVIIARAGNYVFGGYAKVPWNSGNYCSLKVGYSLFCACAKKCYEGAHKSSSTVQ